ncbi:MAG: radical SAM protein [Acidobacteriota bacterium]
MDKLFSEIAPFKEISLWDKTSKKRVPFSFELELTARCNNDCRHCYINLPAGDTEARSKELSFAEIENIADQAVKMGSLWCLLTGGEPLLREDFSEIYLMLKKKGLLISVFTTACLISEEHIELFKKYPPREIEVTVYGVTRKTYENVTRKPGSFSAFSRGMDLLRKNGVKVRLKAMALKTNIHELPEIAAFCRENTNDYFRFDPLLHLRFDGDQERNKDIINERLSPEEIAKVEQDDPERSESLKKNCDTYIFDQNGHHNCNHLFHCGAGQNSFTVSPEGIFRLCSSLWYPDFTYDLKNGSLKEAWEDFVPKVLATTSDNPEYHNKCHSCSIVNLCLWCPAHAYLETGSPDSWVEYFCDVAHARQKAIEETK